MSVSVCMCGTRIRISKHHHLWLEEYHLVCHWRRIWYWEPERGERNWNHPCVRLYIFLANSPSVVGLSGCVRLCVCAFSSKTKISEYPTFLSVHTIKTVCVRLSPCLHRYCENREKKTITTIATKKTDLFIWIVNCYTTSPIRKRDTAKTIPTTKISKCVFFVIFAQFHWILFFNKKNFLFSFS